MNFNVYHSHEFLSNYKVYSKIVISYIKKKLFIVVVVDIPILYDILEKYRKFKEWRIYLNVIIIITHTS